MKKNKKYFLLIACQLVVSLQSATETTPLFELEPLPVTGDLLKGSSDRIPVSLSMIGPDHLQFPDSRHFADLTGYFPNLNWAGGTSRPRYFQIRGIGENSQFGNEIPASSVGFIIDGIDFTGIGTVASLFAASKVEVLRGPQAAAFGANAMAGMIVLETSPASGPAGTVWEGTVGAHNLRSAGFSNNGPIGSNLAYRISVNHHEDDGFRNNTFLQRDNTNGKDELSSQIKVLWTPGNRLSVSLNLLYFDFDNGYDAWALDNDSFNTSTDEPGRDLQSTVASGVTVNWRVLDSVELVYNGSVSDTEMLYSYDWDWSNPAELMRLYGSEVYWGTDITERTRDVWSHDIRLLSAEPDNAVVEWVAGVYRRDFQEEQAYFGIDSDYDTATTALYGQAKVAMGGSIALTVAGRVERHAIDYSSWSPWSSETGSPGTLGDEEDLWGGKVALEYRAGERSIVYLSLDRGYKAGGINLDDEVPVDSRVYGSENLLSYEAGWKAFLHKQRLWLNASIFLMDRRDIQVDSSVQLGDGNTFALYKDNAASGTNRGVEMEVNWRASNTIRVFASAGLLETEFDDYQYVDPADSTDSINLDGREQAYAPSYGYAVGIDYDNERGLFAGAALEGKDAYVFDVVTGQQLAGYNLVRVHIGYRFSGWTITLWTRNLLDERYDVRGFYFANEPPYYDIARKWVTQGDPRQVGFTLNFRF